jgi:hypothetical protein
MTESSPWGEDSVTPAVSIVINSTRWRIVAAFLRLRAPHLSLHVFGSTCCLVAQRGVAVARATARCMLHVQSSSCASCVSLKLLWGSSCDAP